MSLWSLLGNLVIGPLKILFETIFMLVNRIGKPGLSIIVLSLAMNTLVLPLYRRADAIQDEEREKEQRLQKWVQHIRKAFSGDERFMIQQAYYRENHYSPMSALRGALPLALEIPFFIAAYQFLSGLGALKGASFGPIKDLGAPDALLSIGGLTINVIPILMTAVNIVSSSIYTRGASLKSKMQLYVMALVFLIFLYDSPAGLTMYWTLNNVFSLVKNIVTKSKHGKALLNMALSLVGIVLAFIALTKAPSMKWKLVCVGGGLILQIPAVVALLKRRNALRTPSFMLRPPRKGMFFSGAALIALLTGVLIPSSALVSSPAEFLDTVTLHNPTWYVINAGVLALGTFVIWGGVFYLLGNDRMKKGMELGVWILAGVMILNYMAFKKSPNPMNSILQYRGVPMFTAQQKLINLGIAMVVAAVLAFLFIKKETLAQAFCLAGAIATGFMGGRNLILSQNDIREAATLARTQEQREAVIPISTGGKNVVVLMLDRAISSYLPAIFAERPEIRKQFDGFTWYPNTLAHGGYTNFGAPGIFGGYEYVPAAMNARPNESLQEKHNEALLMMPTLFGNEGYSVTVCDPPYAGVYKWSMDLSLYDKAPNTEAYITEGYYLKADSSESYRIIRERNFFCYGLTETLPYAIYGPLYNCGFYNQPSELYVTQLRQGPSVAMGEDLDFLGAYTAITHMRDMTEIRKTEENTFLEFVNCTTHEPVLLAEPEYISSVQVDNTVYDAEHGDRFAAGEQTLHVTTDDHMSHYHVNMAAMIWVGDWLDMLRENNVYDNTRIIIVADHGRDMKIMDGKTLPNGIEITAYNPLLLVKDFGAHGDVKQDNTFMTNADVPYLATLDVIEKPINPFTGNPIKSEEEKAKPQEVTTSLEFSTKTNRGNTFHAATWYAVHDDLFDMKNWTEIGYK